MQLPSHGPSRRSAGPALILLAWGAIAVAACASAPPSPSAPPFQTASTGSEPSSSAPAAAGASIDGVPTACVGLGEGDCRRVAAQVATALTPGDPSIGYVQVGPFGCLDGPVCPTTLAARSEGDVTLEFAGGALGFHVTSTGGDLDIERQEAVGVQVAPSSAPSALAGPQPVTLGHCGLWSGIDVGGSWWDPVGLIDYDHSDAINPAEGTIAPVGPDQAIFTSRAGFTVQLVRHAGQKFLPLCM